MQAASNNPITDDVWAPTKYSAEVKATGEKITLCTSARSGDGKFRFIWTLAPGKRGPHDHYHSTDTEVATIVSGTLRVWLDDVPRDYGPGDVCVIGRGVRHRFLNPGKEPVVVRAEFNGTQMEDTFVPVAVSCYPKQPGVKHMAKMLVYLLEARPTEPTSKWEVRILGAIARVMRFFGVKAHTPIVGWERDAPR